MKKTYSLISTGLVVSTTAISSVACFGSNKVRTFTTSPIENYIKDTAWSNLVLNNPEGHSLDIPELYNIAGYESSNERAFSQTNKKEFKFIYNPKSKNTLDEQIKELTQSLAKQNEEAFNWLEKQKQKNTSAKFAIYFKQDVQKHTLTTRIRELIQDESSPEVSQILKNINKNADMNTPEFPMMHGHLLWQKNWVVKKNQKTGKTEISGFSNIENLYSKNTKNNIGYPSIILEHKIRFNDNNGQIISLDDWKNDPKIMAETDEIKKKVLIESWFKHILDTYLLNTGALLNAYPYIDYEHKLAKIMFISADKNAHLFHDRLGTNSIQSPAAMKNAKRISYKVVTVKNAIPTTTSEQIFDSKYENDLKHALQGALLWLAKIGPNTLKTMFKTLKHQIPYVQGLINKIMPFLNSLINEKYQIFDIDPWERIITQLKGYKNLNDSNRLKKIGDSIALKGFNLNALTEIAKNLVALKQQPNGENIIDVNKSPFQSMDLGFVLSSNGLNQYKITNLLWLLYCASEEMVK